MGSGTKYLALEKFLMDKTENITLTFMEINEIIGEKLPVPSDSAVFKAGYKVEKIDFKTKSVIFSKIALSFMYKFFLSFSVRLFPS